MYKGLTKTFSMTYDGVPLPVDCVVEEIIRPINPEISILTTPKPGENGSYFRRSRLGEKEINVKIRLVEERFPALSDNKVRIRKRVDELKPYLIKDKPKKLYLSDQPTRYDMAILKVSNVTYGKNSALLDLMFSCPGGFSYDLADTKIDLAAEADIFCTGTVKVPMIISGEKIEDTIVIENTTTKETLKINNTFRGKIKIDTDLETYLENDVLSMTAVFPESDFPELCPKHNKLKISGLKNASLLYQGRYL